MIVDASRYFTQAKHLEVYGCGFFIREWGRAVQAWTDLPLVPFLYGLIFKVLGESRAYIQMFDTILFSMTVALASLIGRELWDEETGLAGGALLLGMPYLFSQVPLMLTDVPTMFFLTLSVFTFIRGMRYGGWNVAYAIGSLIAAIFSKYSTWPMLTVLPIIIMVHLKRVPALKATEPGERGEGAADKNKVGRNASLRRGLAIIVAAVLISLGIVLYKYDVFAKQLELLVQFQKPGLGKWGESFLSTFFFQIHPFVTLLALFSFVVALRKKDIRYVIISWLVILLIIFQVRRIRYTVPLLPMVSLMAAYGLQYIRDREVRRFLVVCTVVSSLVVALFGYLFFLQKVSTVNLKAAGVYLNSIDIDEVEAVTLPQKDSDVNPAIAVPLLDLYTKKRLVNSPGYVAERLPGDEVYKSSLRFTWEYSSPPYYSSRKGLGGRRAVVIIAGGDEKNMSRDVQRIISGLCLLRAFEEYEGVFVFRTNVSVYGDCRLLDAG